ncbi:MAG: helix-turn-helix domain-containing protein [Acidobacteriota bacterium]
MPHAKLYSIAAIAKILDLPESTLHYWKNRFDQFLPATGEGRHKRFQPEALDVFRAIRELLDSGLQVSDAKAELSRRIQGAGASGATVITPVPVQPAGAGPSGEEIAMRIGAAMAEAIGQRLQGILGGAGFPGGVGANGMMLPAETVGELTHGLAQAQEEIEAMRRTNEDLAGKLRVLEAELIRLRKDGREMEKHLLGKIKGAAGGT